MVVVVVVVVSLVSLCVFLFLCEIPSGRPCGCGSTRFVVSILIWSRKQKRLCFVLGGTLSLSRDKLSSAEESVDREF